MSIISNFALEGRSDSPFPQGDVFIPVSENPEFVVTPIPEGTKALIFSVEKDHISSYKAGELCRESTKALSIPTLVVTSGVDFTAYSKEDLKLLISVLQRILDESNNE